jgi:hypothetical protein
MPDHRDVRSLTPAELDRARRDRRAHQRGGQMIRVCSCGFATDDPDWLDGHLYEHPDHHEREAPRAFLILGGVMARV